MPSIERSTLPTKPRYGPSSGSVFPLPDSIWLMGSYTLKHAHNRLSVFLSVTTLRMMYCQVSGIPDSGFSKRAKSLLIWQSIIHFIKSSWRRTLLFTDWLTLLPSRDYCLKDGFTPNVRTLFLPIQNTRKLWELTSLPTEISSNKIHSVEGEIINLRN